MGGEISPDGKFILYRTGAGARTSLWLRSLSNESARELPGTEGGFWSPDSLSIGFRAGRELKRVSIDGGDPIRLCELPSQLAGFSLIGGTWSPNGERIVFSSGQRLYEIPARGGEPKLLFDPGNSPRAASVHPHFLPADGGSQRLVYAAGVSQTDQRLAVMDLATGERHELGPGSRPIYSSDGYLIHGPADDREPGLRALPFSLDTLQPTGPSFPIDEAGTGASVSRDGTLVYTDRATSAVSGQMVVRNRSGEILRTVGGRITRGDAPAISPDGRRVAVNAQDDIWVYDLDRDLGTRLTSRAGNEGLPDWVASGRELSYFLDGIGLATQAADGSVEAKVLFDAPGGLFFFDWSRDDRYVAYTSADPAGGEGGLWYRKRGPDGSLSEPASFLRTPAQENMPAFSPDGRYLAYRSDESGRYEVYVRPFPPSPGKWQVSTNGGGQPRWSAHGKEMLYTEGSTLMAVVVSTDGSFTVGPPQRLFELGEAKAQSGGDTAVRYDVFPDGQRFVTLSPAEGDTSPSFRIVENWYEEFRDRE